MGGLDERGYGDKDEDIELFTPSRSRSGRGRLSLLGGSGVLGDPGRPPIGDYYPHLFWMPSGHGLVAGPWTTDTWSFSPPGNPPKLRWKDIPNATQSRVWGTAVLLPAGPDGSHQVEQFGGSDKPKADALVPPGDALATNSVSLFDERHAEAGWNDVASVRRGALNHPRSHANTVLLPDGSMVEVGGGWGDKKNGGENGAPGQWAAAPFHLTTELWSPRSRTWRLGPPQREFRTYHSTAMLLPDGRVVSAGDDYSGRFTGAEAERNFTQDSAEIYEPPYLFDGNAKAPRPKLTRAPARLTLDDSTVLRVRTARGDRPVTRAVLVAPSATTHAVDMNQRYVPLRVKRAAKRGQGEADGTNAGRRRHRAARLLHALRARPQRHAVRGALGAAASLSLHPEADLRVSVYTPCGATARSPGAWWPQLAIVLRRPASAARPIGAGSQIATAR